MASKLEQTIRNLLKEDEGTAIAEPAANLIENPEDDNEEFAENPEVTDPIESPVLEDAQLVNQHRQAADLISKYHKNDPEAAAVVSAHQNALNAFDTKNPSAHMLSKRAFRMNAQFDRMDPLHEDDGMEDVELDPDISELGNGNIDTYKDQSSLGVTQVSEPEMPTMPTAEMGTYMRESISKMTFEDVKVDRSEFGKLFEGQGLTEETITKAVDLFESACNSKIATVLSGVIKTIAESAETMFQSKINEEVANIRAIAEETSAQWLTENQIAIESATRSNITDSFISGLRTLFVEHYIEIPKSKVNLLEAFQSRIEKLEESVSIEMGKTLEAKKLLTESQKTLSLVGYTKGLTTLQAEKVTQIAEGIEFTTAEEFVAKVKTIAEGAVAATVSTTAKTAAPILETVGATVVDPTTQVVNEEAIDPMVARYIQHAKNEAL